ncbi:MAG: AMP-binding protein, partial [Candidatus Hydrogenedentes bacterium]|nr:AMP-binding protein [Candidatus Hydrogenedentota bacterium]
MTLLSLLDRATHASPDHAAVRCRERSLSYAQLQAQVNRLANTLLRLGVRKGDRVAFCMAKDLESIVALYGIMKAGAAYVPLDPLAPPSRSAQVCKDASVRVLITKAANLARTGAAFNGVPLQGIIGVEGFKGFSGSVVSWLEVEAESEACGESPVPGDYDLAYVLYTSGSTGVPKGISHTHESCIAFVEWAVQEFEVSGLDRLANHAPFHFDLSTFDVFAAAAAAATLVIVPETDSRFPAQVARLIEAAGITVWYSVPFALMQILERGSLHERDFSALRLVLFAGEVFPTPSLRQLMMRLPHARFANLYGPTETNVCTYYRLDVPPEAVDLPIPIGVACPFAQLCVVDDADQ